MKRNLITLVAILVILIASCARGSDNGITIEDAWVRAATAKQVEGQDQGQSGMSNSAAYMLIHNNSSAPDTLLNAHSDLARSTELHLSEMIDGVMSMHPVEGVDVPARGKAELKPGSYHVMLVGINRDLLPGEKIALTLQFEKAGEVQIEAEIRSP